MDLCKIGNKVFDVNVMEIEETFNILYGANTGRTIAIGAPMTLDPLGTFFGHRITVAPKSGKEREYDRLFDYVSTPRYDGVMVHMIHGQDFIDYKAYVSTGSRKVRRIDKNTGKVYYKPMQLNIVPTEAQVKP